MKILVFGTTGLLGSSVMKCFMDDHRKRADFVPFTRNHMDLRDERNVIRFFRNHVVANPGFTVFLNCAGIVSTKSEISREDTFAVNGTINASLSYECGTRGLDYYYISTDYVFDGKKGSSYNVTDIPNPQGFYAFTKAIGEYSTIWKGGKIIRTSFCDDNKWGAPGAFTDKFSSRDRVSIIAKIIYLMMKYEDYTQISSNVIHVGTKRKSFYELAKTIYPEVKPMSIKDVNFSVTTDTTLDLSSLKKLLNCVDKSDISTEIQDYKEW
jgi:dTDP-4-dehydrorhamnose reductase